MSMVDISNPNSLASRMRARRDIYLRQIIEKVFAERGKVDILDIGGTTVYWRRVGIDFLRANKATVKVANLEASLDDIRVDADVGDVVSSIVANGCDLAGIADDSFDLAHSNSVIEHVGRAPEMKRFADEALRVAHHYYLQTPNFWFPVDPHFYKFPTFHWMPKFVRVELLRHFPISAAGRLPQRELARQAVDGVVLLTPGHLQSLFPGGRMSMERYYGLNKSIIITDVTV